MKRPGLTEIIVGILLLISISLAILNNSTLSTYYFLLLFVFMTSIIIGIFTLRTYYDKNLLIILITAILMIMWVLSFVWPFSQDIIKIVYYLETGIITITIILVTLYTLKGWKNFGVNYN